MATVNGCGSCSPSPDHKCLILLTFDLFSGIYAFRSLQAEQLFNVLQEAIQSSSSSNMPPLASNNLIGNNAIGFNESTNSLNATIGVMSSPTDTSGQHGDMITMTMTAPVHNYVNDVHQYMNTNTMSAGNPCYSAMPVTSNSLPVNGVTDINTNYAKLDDLVQYYVNIKVASPPLSVPLSLPLISPLNSTISDEPKCVSQSIAPTKPDKVPTPLTLSSDEPMNYIMLDLDTTPSGAGGGPHFVTTAPATPVTKTPKNGENSWTPPGTPTSLSSQCPQVAQSYATIDFDKTVALCSTANHLRKDRV